MTPGSSASTKATLLVASSLTVMAGAAIAPSLPEMRTHFAGVPNAELGVRLLLTVPALTIAIGAPLAGMVIDRWGRTRLLFAGMLLYGLAGSSGLVLDSLSAILVGRVLLGLAVAAIMTSVTALIADYYAGAQRMRLMGWQASFMAFGGVVFLIGGGALAELHWRFPFFMYFVALLLLPVAWVTLPEPARAGRAASLTQIDPGVPDATRFREGPGRVLGFLAGAGLIGMLAFYMIPTQIPFLLEAFADATTTRSGIAIATSTLFGSVTALFYGRVRRRLGFAAVLAVTFGVMGGGYLLIGRAGSYSSALVGLAVCGLGMGLMMPNLNVWLTTYTPEALRGRALGMLTTALFLGQFLSPLVMQPVIRSAGLGGAYSAAGAALILLACGIALGRRRIASFTSLARQPAAEPIPAGPFPAAAAMRAADAGVAPPRD